MSGVDLNCKAPSRQEVENWLERIDDITAAVQDILNEDPMEAEQKRKEREARRREAEAQERRDKVKMRYDPRYYSRFESDELIDALLKEADGPVTERKSRGRAGDEALYSRAERVSLQEALRMKEEAAKAVRLSEWEKSCELYSNAISLNVVDAALQVTLRNNRALVYLKLERYLDAVEDAGYVLREEPTNVKALLRRATALRHLRRPLDALKDAEAALRKDASNREAVELAQWLRRMKDEHERCAAFQHHHPDEAARLSKATRDLIAAVKESRSVDGVNCGKGVEDEGVQQRHKDKCLMRVLKALCRCLKVVQCFHVGAAVLFALCDGMGSLTEVSLGLLSGSPEQRFAVLCSSCGKDMPTECMVLLTALRLLSLVLLGSEACGDELKTSCIGGMANRLAVVLMEAIEGAAKGSNVDTCVSLMPVLLQPLESMATRFPAEVYASCGPLTERMLEGVLRGGRPSPQSLFFLCGFLDALLKVRATAETMAPVLEKAGIRVIEAALTAGPAQLKEVGLSLALRLSYLNDACSQALSTPHFTRVLASVLSFSDASATAPLSARAEEGLFAVVYNLFLKADSRRDYVRQWHDTVVTFGTRRTQFSLAIWCVLRERTQSCGVMIENATVCAKMMGILSKFSSFDEPLRDAVLKDDKMLWSLLDSALSKIGIDTTSTAEEASGRSRSVAEGEGEDSVAKVAALWELVEHTTTLLAGFYSQKLLSSSECLSASQRIGTLLCVIRLGRNRNMVAVGNAALICSFVPPEACVHYATLGGADALLESLRQVREVLFALEHEGKKGTPQWSHARAAQKNIAIALSRCCAVESQRERLRELNGFETLHAVLEQQQA